MKKLIIILIMNSMIVFLNASYNPNMAISDDKLIQTNYVYKSNGTTLTKGTIYDNGTNVSIGTNVPLTKLHIQKTLAANNAIEDIATIDSEFGAATVIGFGGGLLFRGRTVGNQNLLQARIASVQDTNSSNQFGLAFYTAISASNLIENLRISYAGNVGIGGNAPSYPLHLFSSTNAYLALQQNSNTSGDLVGLKFKTSAVMTDSYFKGAIFYQSTGDAVGRGNMIFAQNNVSDVSNATAASSVMLIQPNGNVGIGTTSAGQKLDVNGNIRIQGTGTALPTATVDNRGTLYFLQGAGGVSDKLYICMKTSANTYVWVLVALT